MNPRKASLLERRREVREEMDRLSSELAAINLHLGFYEDLSRLDDRIGHLVEYIEGQTNG